jgi:hypothetical protein
MQSPNLLLSARIWRNTPPALQELVWDRIRDELHRRAEAAGLDPDRAFPAPGQAPFQGGHDDHDDHGHDHHDEHRH